MNISLHLEGWDGVRGTFRRIVRGTNPMVRRHNRRYAALLLAELRQAASGAPGPEVRTGEYRSRMEVKLEDTGLTIIAGNDSPQGPRLELGFVGVDALGRHYAQPPFTHFRPTFEKLAPNYKADLNDELGRLIRG